MPTPPDETSDNPSKEEQKIEQLQQQVADLQAAQKELESIKKQIESGELGKPTDILAKAYEDGTAFPKSRFTGLQNKYQELQQNNESAIEKFNELKSQFSSIEAEKKSFETQIADFTATKESYEKTIAELKGKQERTNMILTDHPELAQFEADGLIPNVPMDELPAVLEKLSSRIGKIQEDGVEKFAKGGGSRQPGGKGDMPKSANELLIQSGEANLRGDREEANRLYDAYLQALDTEK